MDHAGIATQNVVERELAEEGLTRFDLGRDAFVERVWAHVRETGAAILEQLKAIGGRDRSGTRWRQTVEAAIAEIESGEQTYYRFHFACSKALVVPAGCRPAAAHGG